MKQYPFPKNRWTAAAFGLFLFAMLLLARDIVINLRIFNIFPKEVSHF